MAVKRKRKRIKLKTQTDAVKLNEWINLCLIYPFLAVDFVPPFAGQIDFCWRLDMSIFKLRLTCDMPTLAHLVFLPLEDHKHQIFVVWKQVQWQKQGQEFIHPFENVDWVHVNF